MLMFSMYNDVWVWPRIEQPRATTCHNPRRQLHTIKISIKSVCFLLLTGSDSYYKCLTALWKRKSYRNATSLQSFTASQRLIHLRPVAGLVYPTDLINIGGHQIQIFNITQSYAFWAEHNKLFLTDAARRFFSPTVEQQVISFLLKWKLLLEWDKADKAKVTEKIQFLFMVM